MKKCVEKCELELLIEQLQCDAVAKHTQREEEFTIMGRRKDRYVEKANPQTSGGNS